MLFYLTEVRYELIDLPAGCKGYSQYAEALALSLGRQLLLLLLLYLLIGTIGRHLQAVIQLPAAGLRSGNHCHKTVGSIYMNALSRLLWKVSAKMRKSCLSIPGITMIAFHIIH